jgi:hypothetical protein
VKGSIHGLIVVLPLESNPMHYGNDEGLIDKAIDDYDLQCACVGDVSSTSQSDRVELILCRRI